MAALLLGQRTCLAWYRTTVYSFVFLAFTLEEEEHANLTFITYLTYMLCTVNNLVLPPKEFSCTCRLSIFINISSHSCCQVFPLIAGKQYLAEVAFPGVQRQSLFWTQVSVQSPAVLITDANSASGADEPLWAALSRANMFAKQMKSSGCTIRLRSFMLIITQSVNY